MATVRLYNPRQIAEVNSVIGSKFLFQRIGVVQRQFRDRQRSIASTQRELLTCGLSAKETNEFLLKTMRLKVWD